MGKQNPKDSGAEEDYPKDREQEHLISLGAWLEELQHREAEGFKGPEVGEFQRVR